MSRMVVAPVALQQQRPILRRPRKVDGQPLPVVHCAGCGKTIPPRGEFMIGKGGSYHVFCAIDEGASSACQTCNLIHPGPCDL